MLLVEIIQFYGELSLIIVSTVVAEDVDAHATVFKTPASYLSLSVETKPETELKTKQMSVWRWKCVFFVPEYLLLLYYSSLSRVRILLGAHTVFPQRQTAKLGTDPAF